MAKEDAYTNKRDFNITPEPKAGTGEGEKGSPIFVIQKHDATQLHYDFRLEIGGTLKSWSIPKGPSTDPSVKRMAIPTEDHPLSYAGFEGVIPKGQYGGGTVLIWDKGIFRNTKTDDNGHPVELERSYDLGSLEFELEGKKLKGGYALFKMNQGNMKGNWLLIKRKDEFADARRNPVSTEPNSVTSGKSLTDIRKEAEKP